MVATLVESLVELENRRSDLAVKRKDANPELAALNARIVQIDDQLLSVAMSYDRSLQAQIQSLGQALEDHGQELSTIPVKEIRVSRLRRQVNVLEKLYRFLQTRLQEAQVAKAVKLPNVRMVDRASLPYKPSFPNTPLNLVSERFSDWAWASLGLCGGSMRMTSFGTGMRSREPESHSSPWFRVFEGGSRR